MALTLKTVGIQGGVVIEAPLFRMVEASEAGLPPGEWPMALTIVDETPQVTYWRKHPIVVSRTLAGYEYQATNQKPIHLLND